MNFAKLKGRIIPNDQAPNDQAKPYKLEQWLEMLKIDSIRQREFDLGEEPPPLIVDFVQDLAVEIQLQEPEPTPNIAWFVCLRLQ